MKRGARRHPGEASRRSFMCGMLAAGAGVLISRTATAEDAVLDGLIEQGQNPSFGQGFDAASRTILMPNAAQPTLDPSTAQTDRSGDCALRKHRFSRRLVRRSVVAQPALGKSPPERARSARASRRIGRYRDKRRRQRHLRFLRRGGGAPLSGPPRPDRGRHRPRADHQGDERARGDAARAAADQCGAPAQPVGQSRPAFRRLQHPGRAARSDRGQCGGLAPHRRGRQAGPAVARHPEPDRGNQFQSVLDRAGFDRPQGPHSEDAGGAGLPHQEPYPHLRRARGRAAAATDQLVLQRSGELHVQAGSGRAQFARIDPHQFPQQGRRVHARHAVEKPVRRGFPLPFLRLRARAERARTGQLAARRHARLVARGNRSGDQVGRAQGRAACARRSRSTGSMSPPGRRRTGWCSSATISTDATASTGSVNLNRG